MRSVAEANYALTQYADTVRRVCFVYLKNHADVEDVFQEVFLKYMLREQPFESAAHERAWFIRVAINACKDLLKSFFRRNTTSLEELYTEPLALEEEEKGLLQAVLQLPQKYRDVIYLFYYEGYTAVEIADILGKSCNTIYTWLSRAKSALRDQLGGELFGE